MGLEQGVEHLGGAHLGDRVAEHEEDLGVSVDEHAKKGAAGGLSMNEARTIVACRSAFKRVLWRVGAQRAGRPVKPPSQGFSFQWQGLGAGRVLFVGAWDR